MIVKVFVDKIFFSRQSEDLGYDTVGSRQSAGNRSLPDSTSYAVASYSFFINIFAFSDI